MSRTRTLIASTATALVLSGATLLGASSAMAGSLPGGIPNITAPAGFDTAYGNQFNLVKATCWLTGRDLAKAQHRFDRHAAQLNRQLALAGYPASPTYEAFANETFNHKDAGCPKG